MKAILIFIGLLFVLVWSVPRTILSIQFDRNCTGYLKRAADANTVELAKAQLAIAIQYARAHGDTAGFTSVLYRTPDEDVGFWFSNLTASLQELESLKLDASPLERSNMLMKLRETLLDQGTKSVGVTTPDGISVFPHNMAWAFFGWLAMVFGAGLICIPISYLLAEY